MSVTVSTIVSSIGGSLANLAQGAVIAIKVVVSISFALIFAAAILALLGFIQSVIFGSIIGEVFALISLCLPFNPATVFYSVVLITDGILGFMIARKVYELTSNLISVSS